MRTPCEKTAIRLPLSPLMVGLLMPAPVDSTSRPGTVAVGLMVVAWPKIAKLFKLAATGTTVIDNGKTIPILPFLHMNHK
jgi:hypothetical protein